MLQQNLKLVGLAVALAIVGISSGWPVQAQEGVTLDPGTLNTDEAAGQALVAELLSQMIASGYDPRAFDFPKAVIDPLGRAIFVPVKLTDEVKEQIQDFTQNERGLLLMGLLYVRQTTEINGQIYSKGLYPVFAANSTAADTEGPKKGSPSDGQLLVRVGLGGDFAGGGGVIVSGRVCIKVEIPPFFVEVCVGGTIF